MELELVCGCGRTFESGVCTRSGVDCACFCTGGFVCLWWVLKNQMDFTGSQSFLLPCVQAGRFFWACSYFSACT